LSREIIPALPEICSPEFLGSDTEPRKNDVSNGEEFLLNQNRTLRERNLKNFLFPDYRMIPPDVGVCAERGLSVRQVQPGFSVSVKKRGDGISSPVSVNSLTLTLLKDSNLFR
jgi:hypothetical protein